MKSCFVCKSSTSHYSYWKTWEYVKCNKCGLVFVETYPSDKEIYEAYDGGRWKDLRRRMVSPFRKLEDFKIYEEKMVTTGKLLDIVEKHRKVNENSTMLDIGANKGFLLTTAISRGFVPYGIELVPVLMDQFKRKFKKFRKNILSETLSLAAPKFSENFFDVVTAIDLIEHLKNPREDLKSIFRILKDGGLFLIQTPDTDSKDATTQRDQWGALKALEHLNLFNPKNLEILSQQIGFSSIDFYDPVDLPNGNMIAVMTK